MDHQGEFSTQEALRGLKGVYVWVHPLPPEIEPLGLTRERLGREVEGRLKSAHIPILKRPEEIATPLFPSLGILVHIDRSQSHPLYYRYSLEVSLVKAGSPLGEAAREPLQMVWCQGSAGGITSSNSHKIDWSIIFDKVGDLVDGFILDYLAANPGSPASPQLN